jgi:hypothetical protein
MRGKHSLISIVEAYLAYFQARQSYPYTKRAPRVSVITYSDVKSQLAAKLKATTPKQSVKRDFPARRDHIIKQGYPLGLSSSRLSQCALEVSFKSGQIQCVPPGTAQVR